MAILGDNSQGAGGTNGNSDRIFVTRFTAAEAGVINSAGAYFAADSTAGTSAKVVLYNAGASAPTTLVAVSSASAVPGGGGLVTFTMSGTFEAGDYYLGVVYSDFQARLSTDTGLSGMDSELGDPSGAYASPPDLTGWTPLATYSDNRANAYVEYTPGEPPPDVTPIRFLSSGLRF